MVRGASVENATDALPSVQHILRPLIKDEPFPTAVTPQDARSFQVPDG